MHPTAITAVLIVACLGMGMVLPVPYRFITGHRRRKANRHLTRACAAVSAGVVLGAVGATADSASATAARAQTASVTEAGMALAAPRPGTQLWLERYSNPGNGGATSVAASPNGKTVFVTGYVTAGSLEDYATVAYNAVTGARLWAVRYTDPGHTIDRGYSVVVSPNGKTVFVTGTSLSAGPEEHYATIAYNAATGAQRWAERYTGVDTYYAPSAAVSPNGSTVFITGTSTGGGDYATVAYNAVTGHQRWAKLYAGLPKEQANFAHAVAVSHGGTTVFVTGESLGTNNGYDYATVAYNATTGRQLWAERYNGAKGGERGANSVAVSPDGKTVFVTGSTAILVKDSDQYDYATVAYNAATGRQLWAERYHGRGSGAGQADSVKVSPSGKKVFVTGYTDATSTSAGYEYTTIGYSAATGARQWVKTYNGPAKYTSQAYSLAVSPSGTEVYVTGYSYGCICGGEDYATVAYDAATGTQQWVQRYDGAGRGGSQAVSVAVSPTAGTVFITGYSLDVGFDYATVAYRG